MARYQLLEDGGVVDTERGYFIPDTVENRHWREYLDWVQDGNVADPIYVPPPPTALELAQLGLKQSDVDMIRAIDWTLEKLVEKGIILISEIPQGLRDLYQTRKAQREVV